MSYFHLHFLCNQMLVTLDISILPPWFSYWNVYFSENCCMMIMRFSHDGHLRHFLGSMVDKFLSIWWLLSFLLYKSFRITWPFSLISAWFVFFSLWNNNRLTFKSYCQITVWIFRSIIFCLVLLLARGERYV